MSDDVDVSDVSKSHEIMLTNVKYMFSAFQLISVLYVLTPKSYQKVIIDCHKTPLSDTFFIHFAFRKKCSHRKYDCIIDV